MASHTHTFRVTDEELRFLQSIRPALRQPASQLLEAAVVEEAHRLGYYLGERPPRPPSRRQLALPQRGDEPRKKRVTVTFSPLSWELFSLVAAQLDVSEATFLLGATYQFLARLAVRRPEVQHLAWPDHTPLANLPPRHRKS